MTWVRTDDALVVLAAEMGRADDWDALAVSIYRPPLWTRRLSLGLEELNCLPASHVRPSLRAGRSTAAPVASSQSRPPLGSGSEEARRAGGRVVGGGDWAPAAVIYGPLE